jgi:murein DD-endopeptidase MepM/ murein hydrolase activator NlpD
LFQFKEKKNVQIKKYSFIIVLFLIISLMGYIKFSPEFEKKKPEILIKDEIYWNLKKKIDLTLSDQSGIKYYKITFTDGVKYIELDSQILPTPEKVLNLKIEPPKFDMFFKGKTTSIIIQAYDNSKWNYLEGNKATKTINVIIDNKKPVASVVSNTFAIRHGGSAVAVVELKDENLKDAYISFNDEIRFELIPFHKDNYYVSLIAWPIEIKDFKKVKLIVIDKANNITKRKVPLYVRKLKIKKDKIKITNKFIENISTKVLQSCEVEVPDNLSKRFIKQNKDIRKNNIDTIKKITHKYMDKSLVSNFNIYRFKRLRGSKTAASFAEKRSYYHNNNKIDEAWHLGMDWASVKHAPIKVSNSGTVIFNKYLGIYGNSIIIDHGMGLSTLYAHTSSSVVNVGDKVSRNQKIANTGSSGAVLGDHLHFGVLVQGIEVNPKEWMDRKWIKTRITDILNKAKSIIDSK